MQKTALYQEHEKLGAKIVEFAGYAMPVQYPEGILKEHLSVRENAGLFDVSHMGQALLTGEGCAAFCEKLTPSNFTTLAPATAKYTVLTNENGGIVDDLIITKISEDKFFFVYNAGTKEKDEKWITSKLPSSLKFEPLRNRSLLALQGAKAESIISNLIKADFANQKYMTLQEVDCPTYDKLYISRLGYTGEDGFEISVENEKAPQLWQAILSKGAKPIGLGARDSLRLEMGYPLYGHDISDETSPISANLGWIMPKDKRGSFGEPKEKRVGFEIADRSIIREGVEIFSNDNKKIGKVTSGGFSPTLQKPIAQGYIDAAYATEGTEVNFELRGRKIPGKVAKVNFIEPKTKSSK